MLNLWDKGLKNVVCTFGTSGLFNNTAEKLLPYKAAGVSKIYIMYDGDDPGREARDKLIPLIESAGFEVDIINVADGSDPGESTQDDVNEIIEYIK
jgi:DNA primase